MKCYYLRKFGHNLLFHHNVTFYRHEVKLTLTERILLIIIIIIIIHTGAKFEHRRHLEEV